MEKKPNIILITIDALRGDHLGFMGYEKNISPNIDELSKGSSVFTNAYATGPISAFSFLSIFTSTYPLDYQGPGKIKKPRILISEVLKEQGYITAAFHSNPFFSSFFGYDQGWDFFEDVTPSGSAPPVHKKNKRAVAKKLLVVVTELLKKAKRLETKLMLNFSPEIVLRERYLLYRSGIYKKPFKIYSKEGATINQIVKEFILSVKDEKKPFFIWIHYLDVHDPYFPYENYFQNKPVPYLSLVSSELPVYLNKPHFFKSPIQKFSKKYINKIIDLYDQGIKYVDQQVGDLFKFLKKENIYQDSIICLTADHGDEFLEHGGMGHFAKLYNEFLHVPFLIKIPRNKNKIIEKKVSSIDLSPTLCHLVGIKPVSAFKGRNLFNNSTSPIFHQVPLGASPDLLEIDPKKYMIACQFNNWKYILDKNTKREELYNLSQDSKEQNNLSQEESEILFEARKKVKEFEEKNPPFSLLIK